MKKIILLLSSILFFISCQEKVEIDLSENNPDVKHGVAVLEPLNNSSVSGIVYFDEGDGFIEITADITGLSTGDHGFHAYQYGDLRSVKGEFLGKVFHLGLKMENKDDVANNGRLLGDFGSIYAISDSIAQFRQQFFMISLGGENSILGRSIVIHKEDADLSEESPVNPSQPVAAGVIGIRNEEAF